MSSLKGPGPRRCPWGDDPLLITYHDLEWGTPLHDDRALFELLTLECMQAGLSWITVLRKREAFRRAFDGFSIDKVASYGPGKVDDLVKDPGIIRNRRKIEAAIHNAKLVMEVQREWGSFDRYIWSFTGGRPRQNHYRTWKEVPPESEESQRMSQDLRSRGFRFVGPTICYAFMQAIGMVNDHLVSCYRHEQLG